MVYSSWDSVLEWGDSLDVIQAKTGRGGGGLHRWVFFRPEGATKGESFSSTIGRLQEYHSVLGWDEYKVALIISVYTSVLGWGPWCMLYMCFYLLAWWSLQAPFCIIRKSLPPMLWQVHLCSPSPPLLHSRSLDLRLQAGSWSPLIVLWRRQSKRTAIRFSATAFMANWMTPSWQISIFIHRMTWMLWVHHVIAKWQRVSLYCNVLYCIEGIIALYCIVLRESLYCIVLRVSLYCIVWYCEGIIVLYWLYCIDCIGGYWSKDDVSSGGVSSCTPKKTWVAGYHHWVLEWDEWQGCHHSILGWCDWYGLSSFSPRIRLVEGDISFSPR